MYPTRPRTTALLLPTAVGRRDVCSSDASARFSSRNHIDETAMCTVDSNGVTVIRLYK